jgi:transcriptional regulator with XRE-family HTH domain
MKNQQYQQFREFREKLRAYRKGAGFNQLSFAEFLSVGHSTLKQIETGYASPSLRFLSKLCKATRTITSDWVTDNKAQFLMIETRGGSLPKGLKAQVARLNDIGKKRLELYIEANVVQLNEF